MSLRERFDDIMMVVQNDRRVWTGAGLLFVSILIVLLSSDSKPSKRKINGKHNQVADTSSFTPDEAWQDLITAFNEDVKSLGRQSKENKEITDRMASEFRDYKKDSNALFERIVSAVEDVNSQVENLQNRPAPQVQVASVEQPLELEGSQEMLPFGFDVADIPPPPTKPSAKKVKFIGPSDAVEVRLLTGVNAPVDGTPYPVTFELAGPVLGPDGSVLDLGSARILAMAQGSEVDSRVLYRLQNMSLRHSNGMRSVVSVDGWIIGEDGIRGMKGKLHDKLGELIVASGITAAGSSFVANSFDSTTNNSINNSSGVNVSGDSVENAAAAAIVGASDKLLNVYIDRYEGLVPVVEVLPGRQAVAVFSQPIEVMECEEDCGDTELNYASF